MGLTYRDAGVDTDEGDALVERIKPHARRTLRPEVLAGIGGFGGLFEVPKGYREPVLVAGTDGVGTKLKLAFTSGRHETVGIDLAAMSVNDVVVCGAEPVVFLDYFATSRLRADRLRADRRGDGGAARVLRRGRVRPGRLLRGRGGEIADPRRLARPGRRRRAGAGLERPALERLLLGAEGVWRPAHGGAARPAARAHAHLREGLPRAAGGDRRARLRAHHRGRAAGKPPARAACRAPRRAARRELAQAAHLRAAPEDGEDRRRGDAAHLQLRGGHVRRGAPRGRR